MNNKVNVGGVECNGWRQFVEQLKPGNLVVLAGHSPAVMTDAVLELSSNVVREENVKVAYFSLAMSKNAIAYRIHELELDVNKLHMRIDCSAQRVSEIYFRTAELQKNYYIPLVVIDYLQLLLPDHECRHRKEAMAAISHDLKQLAREQEVALLVLVQLNRLLPGTTEEVTPASLLREAEPILFYSDAIMTLK